MNGVLFDLDGTLTDPKVGITRCINFALAGLGEPEQDPEVLGQYIGPPLQETLRQMLGCDRAEKALTLYRERFAEIGIYENELILGIPEALAELQSSGLRLVVATSKAELYAVRVIEHFGLGGYFTHVYGSEFDGTRANKADLIEYVLAHESFEKAVMVGDREHDAIGARKAGIDCVGVTFGYGSGEELLNAGCVSLAHWPAELPAAIEAAFYAART